jgi:hypothetical protein
MPVHATSSTRPAAPRSRRALRLADLERRFDGAIPPVWRAAAASPAERAGELRAALLFWRQEVREAVAQLRLWRSGADRRRDAVAPAIATLRERTLERRIATAWQRYRTSQRRLTGC